jgi:hypothetical protein
LRSNSDSNTFPFLKKMSVEEIPSGAKSPVHCAFVSARRKVAPLQNLLIIGFGPRLGSSAQKGSISVRPAALYS